MAVVACTVMSVQLPECSVGGLLLLEWGRVPGRVRVGLPRASPRRVACVVALRGFLGAKAVVASTEPSFANFACNLGLTSQAGAASAGPGAALPAALGRRRAAAQVLRHQGALPLSLL